MSKKILVVGGAGYIGSHVVKALRDAGYAPIIFDNLSSGVRENVLSGTEFIQGDVRNYEEILSAIKGVDGVVYLAALKAAGESMIVPEKYAVNNIYGAINLFNAMCEAGVKNIIFSSTAAIYGNPQYLPIDEKHPTEPINFYGFTKIEIERILKWYDQLKGIKYAALRYFNAVGYDPEGEVHGLERNPQNLLPILMEAALGTRPYVEVYGDDYETPDGSCVRDYIHVTDLARAHVMALEKLFAGSESMTINLGTSLGLSVFEMIDEVKKISGKDFEVRVGARRPGDSTKLLADSSKALEVLNWKPEYSDLETIVKTTWEAYLKN